MKFKLFHNGELVAESNWSTILFSYVRSRPASKQGSYEVRKTEGLPATGISLVEDVEGKDVLTPAQKAARTRAANKKAAAARPAPKRAVSA